MASTEFVQRTTSFLVGTPRLASRIAKTLGRRAGSNVVPAFGTTQQHFYSYQNPAAGQQESTGRTFFRIFVGKSDARIMDNLPKGQVRQWLSKRPRTRRPPNVAAQARSFPVRGQPCPKAKVSPASRFDQRPPHPSGQPERIKKCQNRFDRL